MEKLSAALGMTITGPGTYPVTKELKPTSHVRIPEGVILSQGGGGRIDFSAATVEIPGAYQVFSGWAPGEIKGLPEAYPEWWEKNVAPGTTDMATAIQSAMDATRGTGATVILSATTYGISKSLQNLSSDTWITSTPKNGVKLIGRGPDATIIKALPGFPSSGPSALINLDGNVGLNTDPKKAVGQLHNLIEGLTLDGTSMAARGLRIRANVQSDFNDIQIKDTGDSINDVALLIVGVEEEGKADADTTLYCGFRNLSISGRCGWGVYAVSARVGNLVFDHPIITSCRYDGMRIAFAGLTLIAPVFGRNGNEGSPTTGGFSAVTASGKSATRGLTILGGVFEANYWHDLNLDSVYGFSVSGLTIHPYRKCKGKPCDPAIANPDEYVVGQDSIRIGSSAQVTTKNNQDIGGAHGGSISGVRFQMYSYPALGSLNYITAFQVYQYTEGVDISGVSFDPYNYADFAARFDIAAEVPQGAVLFNGAPPTP